jgi:hypothetical protein
MAKTRRKILDVAAHAVTTCRGGLDTVRGTWAGAEGRAGSDAANWVWTPMYQG